MGRNEESCFDGEELESSESVRNMCGVEEFRIFTKGAMELMRVMWVGSDERGERR